MALDASFASEIEDWAVVQVRTLDEFADDQVILYPGMASWVGGVEGATDEYLALVRKPFVSISWRQFAQDFPGAESVDDVMHVFDVWIVAENPREAAARVGEAGTPVMPGTNLLMELVRSVLHDKAPAQDSTELDRTSELTKVRSGQAIWSPRGLSIVAMELVVKEVASA